VTKTVADEFVAHQDWILNMRLKHIFLIFGIVPTIAAVTIWKMMKDICKMLKSHPAAEESFSDAALMKVYARMVQIREPMVKNVIGFVEPMTSLVGHFFIITGGTGTASGINGNSLSCRGTILSTTEFIFIVWKCKSKNISLMNGNKSKNQLN
jgi:hypothetical protein